MLYYDSLICDLKIHNPNILIGLQILQTRLDIYLASNFSEQEIKNT